MSGEIQKQFLLTSKIGNGNFSIVFLAKNLKTEQIVAVKRMNNHIPIAFKQAQILKKMNHPNVIKLYKFQKQKNKEQALMVLEYVPQNILELYQAQEYGLKEDQVKCILFQCCLGLNHIHKKGIIHRDVKPENIMINRNKAEVKLIDFGLAVQQSTCTTDYVATRWYRAPQNLLVTKQYTVAMDIFSLGCVVVQLYLGNPLFPGANNIDQINKILNILGQPTIHSWKKGYQQFMNFNMKFQINKDKKRINLKNILSSCSQGLLRLIQKMLILNPSKRITAQQILKDSYFYDIQKIIPPHVYDQFLIDIKTKKFNSRYQISRYENKPVQNKYKERIRFLSEQKSFGAFSSFKSSQMPININKFQIQSKNKLHESIKDNQKIISHQNPIKKSLSIKHQMQGINNHKVQNSMKNSNMMSSKSSRIIETNSQLHKSIQKSAQFPNFSQKVTNSFQKIENSSQKFNSSNIISNSSFKKPGLLKNGTSFQKLNFQNQKQRTSLEPNSSNYYQSNQNSQRQIFHNQIKMSSPVYKNISQTLSFRGFNQPKQKVTTVTKQAPSTNFNKKFNKVDNNSNQFNIKSQKVIQYLQQFQNKNRPQQKGQKSKEKGKLQTSRSEPLIYKYDLAMPKTFIKKQSNGIFIKQSVQGKQGSNSIQRKVPIKQSKFFSKQPDSPNDQTKNPTRNQRKISLGRSKIKQMDDREKIYSLQYVQNLRNSFSINNLDQNNLNQSYQSNRKSTIGGKFLQNKQNLLTKSLNSSNFWQQRILKSESKTYMTNQKPEKMVINSGNSLRQSVSFENIQLNQPYIIKNQISGIQNQKLIHKNSSNQSLSSSKAQNQNLKSNIKHSIPNQFKVSNSFDSRYNNVTQTSNNTYGSSINQNSKINYQSNRINPNLYNPNGISTTNVPKNYMSSDYIDTKVNTNNRSIQNKIKLIAVRDNILIQKPTFINNSNQQIYIPKPAFLNQNISNKLSKISYEPIYSPKNQTFYKLQNYPNLYNLNEVDRRNSINPIHDQRPIFFKSLEHRQFFTKKTNNRYSINMNQEAPYLKQETKNYSGNQQLAVLSSQRLPIQKTQTTLSQLRQSITGVNQTLNQDMFINFQRQQRQKLNSNKNINIKLNLNIYQKRPFKNK